MTTVNLHSFLDAECLRHKHIHSHACAQQQPGCTGTAAPPTPTRRISRTTAGRLVATAAQFARQTPTAAGRTPSCSPLCGFKGAAKTCVSRRPLATGGLSAQKLQAGARVQGGRTRAACGRVCCLLPAVLASTGCASTAPVAERRRQVSSPHQQSSGASIVHRLVSFLALYTS